MKYYGIWTEKKPDLIQLRKEGFNTLFIKIGWFWDEAPRKVKDATNVLELQEMTAFLMRDYYKRAVQLGFEYFVIDAGWGLGCVDLNYFFEIIVAIFAHENNVYFYYGEPIEGLLETRAERFEKNERIFSFRDMLNVLDERLECDERFVFDATTRNYRLLEDNYLPEQVTISSYYKQDDYWASYFPWVWIYGQLNWHSFHSLRFKRLLGVAKARKVPMAILYQGDPAKWDKINFGVKILDILGLRSWFESWQRKRFIDYCKKYSEAK